MPNFTSMDNQKIYQKLIDNDKPIYFWCTPEIYDDALDWAEGFVTTESGGGIYHGKPIYSVYDLCLLERGSYIIVAFQPEMTLDKIASVLLRELELRAKTDYLVLRKASYVQIGRQSGDWRDVRDSRLMYTQLYNEYDNEFPGFKVFGDKGAPFKIVTLGGSTTDPTLYGMCSWSEALYYMLRAHGFDAAIYCGGFMGVTSQYELDKLIRDVVPLAPDLVISYGLVNDITLAVGKWKGHHQYRRRALSIEANTFWHSIQKAEGKEVSFGLQNAKTDAEFWCDNQLMMHAICETFNIRHIAVSQVWPYVYGKPSDQLYELLYDMVAYGESRPFLLYNMLNRSVGAYDDVEEIMADKPFYWNFRDIFKDCKETDVYCEHIHASEGGNAMIAARIFENLLADGYLKQTTSNEGR